MLHDCERITGEPGTPRQLLLLWPWEISDKQLKGRRLYFGSQFESLVHHGVGKTWLLEWLLLWSHEYETAGHTAPVSGNRESGCQCLIHFLPLIQTWTPNLGDGVAPVWQWVFPLTLNFSGSIQTHFAKKTKTACYRPACLVSAWEAKQQGLT